ncbi:maleate cis-trans isomerase family protein [Antrihabitans cavernicola]|uniref:Maleate cis-trans isomerase n=1 Tax=Antrihabitans cavernicola TaxID=2495913 RepID=A0A5A7S9B7_9NOCA|nr:aspartate/glutamate racemase family protein [Spelaeibacter cavernicola]KAA0022496.1 maleate cis-trans isomerase [Spelaeibacter cavernicola]
MSKQLPTVGILYPGYSAEDDFPRFESLLDNEIALPVQHTLMNEDAHRLDALLDWGRPETLSAGAAALQTVSPDAVMWACTSGSFAYGWDGAHDQAAQLAESAGVPASSTSLAFVDALRSLRIRKVAIAATYPADVAALFEQFLAAADIEVIRVSSHEIFTAAEVGTLSRERLLDIAQSGDDAFADAILLPDTAFHTAGHLEALETQVGKPVLTANQVTVWQALRLARTSTRRDGLGSLFRA